MCSYVYWLVSFQKPAQCSHLLLHPNPRIWRSRSHPRCRCHCTKIRLFGDEKVDFWGVWWLSKNISWLDGKQVSFEGDLRRLVVRPWPSVRTNARLRTKTWSAICYRFPGFCQFGSKTLSSSALCDYQVTPNLGAFFVDLKSKLIWGPNETLLGILRAIFQELKGDDVVRRSILGLQSCIPFYSI